jgi:glycosyltransferase involved in cell wall biosynthesis
MVGRQKSDGRTTMESNLHARLTPMRILHLANYCEMGNGIVNVAVDLACKQAETGQAVAFASGGGSYVELLANYGVEHHLVQQWWRRPEALIFALFRLRRLCNSFRPDIVHAHMVSGAVLARILRARSTFRVITTVHNEWQRSAPLMGVGDRVIAISTSVAEHMQRRGIPAHKLHVVRNGPLGSPRRPPLETSGNAIDVRRPAIVTVAGLYHRKGIIELIAAFGLIAASFPHAYLYIVGDGPDANEFKTQAASMPCADRIVFTGFCCDPRLYLAQADVFVLASRSESFGLVVAEAREMGCAVVASDVGGIPEALDGGKAGILVPPRNAEAVAQALAHLLKDHQELSTWRRRARQNIEWLQVGRAAEETLKVYHIALAAGTQ